MRKVLIFIVVASFSVLAIGQEKANKKPSFEHYLGFGAGFTTGVGISYRYVPSKFGIQATLGPSKYEDRVDLFTGLSFLYYLHKDDVFNFYLYQGNMYRYYQDTYLDWNSSTGRYDEEISETESYVSHGIGMGAELILIDRLSFNVMGGYGAHKNFEIITLTIESGLYFRF